MGSPDRSGRIFINYRRDDSAYAAGWLYDQLSEQFGSTQIFKDVDNLQPGDDFVEKITSAVGSCDVLLAVIGPDWVSAADEHGNPRLQDHGDFVRVEIEAALTRNVRVIPVLVEGARMPRSDELPATLAPLSRRHAHELTSGRFNRDTDILIAALRRALPPAAEDRVTATASNPKNNKTPPTTSSQASASGLPPTRGASTFISRHRWWVIPLVAAAVVFTGYLGVRAISSLVAPPSDSSGRLPDDVMVWQRHRGPVGELATISVSGSDEQPLRQGGTGADSAAVISRDRRSILFLHRPPGSHRNELRIISADRSGEMTLFIDGTEQCPELHRPAVDNKSRIAVVCSGFSQAAGKTDYDDKLLLMQQNGTSPITLAHGQLGDPTFTHDGSSIVYWSNHPSSKADGGALYKVAADGQSHPVQLTRGASGQHADPACSPVNDEVAFRNMGADGRPFIQVIRSDQGMDQTPRTLEAGDRPAQDPSWSPDGTRIAFRSGAGKDTDLWVMEADGSGAHQIVDNPGADGAVSWSSR